MQDDRQDFQKKQQEDRQEWGDDQLDELEIASACSAASPALSVCDRRSEMTLPRRLALVAGVLLLVTLAALGGQAVEPATPEAAEDGETCIGKARLRGLDFGRGDSVLGSEDAVILDLVAELIRERCAGKTIVIEGHTDVWGAAEHNRRLSERRAESVRRYLVERGVPGEQLRVEGLGESRPLTTDPSREAQALNRRVTLRVEPVER